MNVPAPHYLLFSESQPSPSARTRQASCGSPVGLWRFVLETVDGQIRFEAADEETESDSGRLALLAVVRGLESLEQPSRVTIVTTSQYVSRGFLFGLKEWREQAWCWERFGEMTPIRNRDLWQRIDRAMRYHQVECRVWRFDAPSSPAPVAAASPDDESAFHASARERADELTHQAAHVRPSAADLTREHGLAAVTGRSADGEPRPVADPTAGSNPRAESRRSPVGPPASLRRCAASKRRPARTPPARTRAERRQASWSGKVRDLWDRCRARILGASPRLEAA